MADSSKTKELYLFGYNLFMAAGWGYALYLGVTGAFDSSYSPALAGCMASGGSVVGTFSGRVESNFPRDFPQALTH